MNKGMYKVAVLLSTYNGSRYLKEQIESVLHQNDVDAQILVRDDGSADNTMQILSEYQLMEKLCFYSGSNKGPAYSYLELIKKAPDADYYAFCDQDDVWLPNKLVAGCNSLSSISFGVPGLYFSDVTIVDAKLNIMKQRHLPKTVLSLGQALIRNNATGCTFVFNKRLKELIVNYTPKYIDMHDHWLYLVALAVGGEVIFDNQSHILYRQHEHNVVGGRYIFRRDLTNKINMTINKIQIRKKIAKEILEGYTHMLSKDHMNLLEIIRDYDLSIKNQKRLLFDRRICQSDNKWHNFTTRIAVLLKAF